MQQNIRKELIRVTIDCNANCFFCNFCRENEKDFINPTKQELINKIDDLAKSGANYIVFSGGEPLIYKDIMAIIFQAKKNGFKDIELQTNALALDDKMVEELKNSGLTRLFISLHSHNNQINKKLFNSFYDTNLVVGNIKKLNQKGFKITLNPVVNSLTYKLLPAFAKFIVENFPWLESVSLSIMQPHGRGYLNKNLLPNYKEIESAISIFRDLLNKNNIKVVNPYCGLPMCIANWHRYPEDNVEYAENYIEKRQDQNKVYLNSCNKCKFQFLCNGVWREYPQIFGEREVNSWLRPVKI